MVSALFAFFPLSRVDAGSAATSQEFKVRIENVSKEDTLKPSNGAKAPAAVAPGVWAVDRFTEKPDAERAASQVARGALWNSGMIAWTARRFFAETAAHAPELAPHIDRLRAGDVEGFFGAVTPVAVDVSHFERSRRVVVLPGAFPWDDVGTWSALGRVRGGDEAANVAVGPVTLRGCARTVAWSDGDPVVVDGVEGLVVVQANGRVLVTTHARAAHLKDLLDHLPPAIGARRADWPTRTFLHASS